MPKALLNVAAALVALAGASNVALASAGGGDTSGGEPHFVPLDAIEVPIVGSSRVEGTLRVKLVLDAQDAAAADALGERLPQLRSSSLAATLEFSRLYASGFVPVNAELLRSEMTAALKREHPGVAQVLIVEVAAQPA